MQTPSGIAQIFLDNVAIKDLAKFLRKCHSIRFTEDDAKEPAAKVPPNASVAQTQNNSTRRSICCNDHQGTIYSYFTLV